MTTRAEWFRYEAQRSHAGGAAAEPQKAKRPAEHESKRSGKRAIYALEAGAGRPSRKSTRKAANRQKNDVQFRMKRREAESRPRP
jgi:hypothetical protein